MGTVCGCITSDARILGFLAVCAQQSTQWDDAFGVLLLFAGAQL